MKAKQLRRRIKAAAKKPRRSKSHPNVFIKQLTLTNLLGLRERRNMEYSDWVCYAIEEEILCNDKGERLEIRIDKNVVKQLKAEIDHEIKQLENNTKEISDQISRTLSKQLNDLSIVNESISRSPHILEFPEWKPENVSENTEKFADKLTYEHSGTGRGFNHTNELLQDIVKILRENLNVQQASNEIQEKHLDLTTKSSSRMILITILILAIPALFFGTASFLGFTPDVFAKWWDKVYYEFLIRYIVFIVYL